MPQKSYPFAAIIIKARERFVLGNEKIVKLQAAKDAQQAADLLMEWRYGEIKIENPREYETLINREMSRTHDLLMKISPDPEMTTLFFLRYDYHNLKVLYKSRAAGASSTEKNFAQYGTLQVSTLTNAVFEKKYTDLTRPMQNVLNELDKTFALDPDPSVIDIMLDRGYAQEIVLRLHDRDEYIKRYFYSYIDWENIRMLIRSREAKLSRNLFTSALLPGGNIRMFQLEKAYDLPMEELASAFAAKGSADGFAAAIEEYMVSLRMQSFEKRREDFLLKIALEQKNNLFSAGPLIAYWIRKDREAKAVKTIMAGKVEGIAADIVNKSVVEV